MAGYPLTDLLLRAGLEVGALPDDGSLEQALERAVSEARRQHPNVALPTEAFVLHLARHLPRAGSPLAALADLDAGALLLCCACARGDAAAMAEIERSHLGKARAAIRRIRGSATLSDDVEQKVREMLFLPGKDGGEPRILKYAGRGDLGGFLRTVAMRTAFQLVDPGREIAGADDALAAASAPGPDPELAIIKAQHGAALKLAMEEALRSIPEDSRRDLRRYYFEGMNVEAMGAADGVAVSTISRRLARAREVLLRTTRALLERRLALGGRELDSMLRLTRTQLEITRGALATSSHAEGPSTNSRAESTDGRAPPRRRKRAP